MLTRRHLAAIALLTLAGTGLAAAHHGPMPWDRSTVVSIEGFVSKEMDGFPHWEIHVRVDGADWEVDVGDNFVLKRAGLREDGSDFTIGRKIVVEGYRPLDPAWLRLLPLRVILDGKTYELDASGSE